MIMIKTSVLFIRESQTETLQSRYLDLLKLITEILLIDLTAENYTNLIMIEHRLAVLHISLNRISHWRPLNFKSTSVFKKPVLLSVETEQNISLHILMPVCKMLISVSEDHAFCCDLVCFSECRLVMFERTLSLSHTHTHTLAHHLLRNG